MSSVLLNFFVERLSFFVTVLYYIAPMNTRETTITCTNIWILSYFIEIVNHLSFVIKFLCNHACYLSFPFCNYTISHSTLRVKSFRDRIYYNNAQTFGKKIVQHYYLTRIAARYDRTRASEHINVIYNYNKINYLLLNNFNVFILMSEWVSIR